MNDMEDLIAGIGRANSRMLTALAAAMLQEVVSRDIARQNKGSAEQQTDNTGSPKFPTKIMVISHIESGRFGSLSEREADIVSESVSFICRKLRAGA